MIFTTEAKAIDPKDGVLKRWCGPRIEAISWADAERKVSDRGYLEVTGRFVAEIDYESGHITPDPNMN